MVFRAGGGYGIPLLDNGWYGVAPLDIGGYGAETFGGGYCLVAGGTWG
jgi:hypothetical protein